MKTVLNFLGNLSKSYTPSPILLAKYYSNGKQN